MISKKEIMHNLVQHDLILDDLEERIIILEQTLKKRSRKDGKISK